MPPYDLARLSQDQPLLPVDQYLMATAAACHAVPGVTTSFEGIFVDCPPGSSLTHAPWEITHAGAFNAADLVQYRKATMAQRVTEFAAITIVVSALRHREQVRVREVMRVGTGSDYVLEDLNGQISGSVEVSGINAERTSDIANRKRTQTRRTAVRPRRIGVVAFVGMELRVERVP